MSQLFSGKDNATGNKGLEGALRATETSCVPLLENQALTKVS